MRNNKVKIDNKHIAIDWESVSGFTMIPLEVSKIPKYKGKRFSLEQKAIYSYFSKLQYDGILNTGLSSYKVIMERFGISSKGTLQNNMQRLVELGLLKQSDYVNGVTYSYEVLPIEIEFIGSSSVTHTKDSNCNKHTVMPPKKTKLKLIQSTKYPEQNHYSTEHEPQTTVNLVSLKNTEVKSSISYACQCGCGAQDKAHCFRSLDDSDYDLKEKPAACIPFKEESKTTATCEVCGGLHAYNGGVNICDSCFEDRVPF